MGRTLVRLTHTGGANTAHGPPPWLPRDLLRPPSGEPAMSEYCFDMAWREFSHRARAQQGNRAGIRYYAEKHMDTRKLDLAELPPVKVIVLLRDPRDTYISIRAFDRKRRESGHKGLRCGPRTPIQGGPAGLVHRPAAGSDALDPRSPALRRGP